MALSLPLVACGGSVGNESEDPAAGGSGGIVSAGGSGGNVTTGGSGGVATGGAGGVATGGTGGTRECVPNPEPGVWVEPTCADLDGLTVSEPELIETEGDGVISPGETITLRVSLNETSGDEMMYYPGVLFSTDNPLVKAGNEGWLYGIFGCTSMEVTSSLTIDPSVPHGTTIQVTAEVAMLHEDCSDTNSLTFTVQVN